jgi:hypothetical protein
MAGFRFLKICGMQLVPEDRRLIGIGTGHTAQGSWEKTKMNKSLTLSLDPCALYIGINYVIFTTVREEWSL